MPTPFAQFASVRLIWVETTAKPADLRDGPRPGTSRSVVIEAYIEPTPAGPAGTDAGGGEIGSQNLKGFITRWALLPSGANWLDAGAAWSWDDSGLRPAGLVAGTRMEAVECDLAALPSPPTLRRGWLTIGTLSGTGGVDAIVRAAAGDEFSAVFADGR